MPIKERLARINAPQLATTTDALLYTSMLRKRARASPELIAPTVQVRATGSHARAAEGP